MTASSFVTPRRIVYGEGALANATAQLAIMGAKALVVTDSFMGKPYAGPVCPMVAIPTTAGTGSEATQFMIIHGMSRPIGALFHVPHGLSNAMLMEACFDFALDGAYVEFAEVARYCGLSDAEDDAVAARDLMGAIHELLVAVRIPTLEEFGVEREAFEGSIDKMAADAEASGSPANTIKPVTQSDMRAIYRSLYA